MITTTLKINDRELKAKAETIIETFDKVVEELAWPKSKELLKTSGIFTVKEGKLKGEIELRLMPLKRFINNRITREIWADRVKIRMR